MVVQRWHQFRQSLVEARNLIRRAVFKFTNIGDDKDRRACAPRCLVPGKFASSGSRSWSFSRSSRCSSRDEYDNPAPEPGHGTTNIKSSLYRDYAANDRKNALKIEKCSGNQIESASRRQHVELCAADRDPFMPLDLISVRIHFMPIDNRHTVATHDFRARCRC